MSHQVDYLPVAVAVGNNADTQANFQGSGYQLDGFINGVAVPQQFNKIVRQSSMQAAALANFISNELGIDVIDDGNLTTLITNLTNAIMAAARNNGNAIVLGATSTPTWDVSQGRIFEMTLTSSVTGLTITNVSPGDRLFVIIHQDATGGHTFTMPSALPMSAIATGASQTSTQAFIVGVAGNIWPIGPMIVS